VDKQEFWKRVVRGGYANCETLKDYTELHDEPYTEEDIVDITRLQDWREAHDPYHRPYYRQDDEDCRC